MDAELLERIVSIFARHVPRAQLVARPADEVHLQNLAISSVDFITLVVEVEDTFLLEVRDEYIHTLVTLGDVVRAVEARRPRSGATP